MPPDRDELQTLLGNAPAQILRGADDSLFLAMRELGATPPSGRMMRGLSPWLDAQGVAQVFLFTERRWREPWRPDRPQARYQELVHWVRGENGGTYRGTAWTGAPLQLGELTRVFRKEPASLVDYAARLASAAVVSNRQPLRLAVEYIPKPWGREGWLTGIEQRGVSRVRSGTGETALPYALGMFPEPLLGRESRTPILLKTLEPHPHEVLGDLYLEVHDQKWETYVVLDVDREAWPEGEGLLRAGLAPEAVEAFRAEHGDDWEDAVAADLRERIAAYESVRRRIDEQVDAWLAEAGEDPAQPVAPERHAELLARLPDELQAAEREARERVQERLGRVPLRVGDAACLPPGVLHSLQHGVTVVEFQTPTYERLIAMFTQKVLTQPHWDTDDALARMEKAPYTAATPEVRHAQGGATVERVVSYPEFSVDRITLERSRNLKRPESEHYRLLFVVAGTGTLSLADDTSHTLVKQDALLLPATMGGFTLRALGREPMVLLEAEPSAEAG